MTKIELPRAIWDKAANTAMGELDNVETGFPNREEGPAFWTIEQAAELRRVVSDIWSDQPIVIVRLRDDLASIFQACFEVGCDDGSDWLDCEYEAIMEQFALVSPSDIDWKN